MEVARAQQEGKHTCPKIYSRLHVNHMSKGTNEILYIPGLVLLRCVKVAGVNFCIST